MAASQKLNASPLWCPQPCLLQLWLLALRAVQNPGCFWRQHAGIKVLPWQGEASKHAAGPELPVCLVGGLMYFLCWYLPEFMKSPSTCDPVHRLAMQDLTLFPSS